MADNHTHTKGKDHNPTVEIKSENRDAQKSQMRRYEVKAQGSVILITARNGNVPQSKVFKIKTISPKRAIRLNSIRKELLLDTHELGEFKIAD